MRALSIRIRNTCVHWAYYASETNACNEHTHQVQVLMRVLSICISSLCGYCANASVPRMLSISGNIPSLKRSLQNMLKSEHTWSNWCVHWAYASGINACTELMYKKPMRAMSILRIRSLCLHWAYASVAYAWFEHTHKELMRLLSSEHVDHSISIRNLCVFSACA